MKTVLFCISVGFIFFSLKGYSQIKVYEDNRVKIFGDRPTDDANKDLSMQIYGPYGQYLANGKLGFGDYPIEPNLFIGEYGEDIDSDKLELHGDDGIYLTWGKGYDFNNIIAHINYIPYLVENPFYFNTDVYATGIMLFLN